VSDIITLSADKKYVVIVDKEVPLATREAITEMFSNHQRGNISIIPETLIKEILEVE